MATLGSLRLDLGMNLAMFASDLGKATRMTQGFSNKLSGIARGASQAFAGIGAGLAVRGIAHMIQGSIDAADAMNDLSQKTGIAVEKLSDLKFMAEGSGVEDLDGALVKFNRTIAEAASGSKAQAQAFADLGISVTDASGQIRPTTDLLRDVADRFSVMPDGAKKTAAAMDLLGKSGADLIPMLNGGAQGFDEAAKQAARFGSVMTTDVARASDHFNDQLRDSHRLIDNYKLAISAGIIPVLSAMLDEFNNTSNATERMRSAMDSAKAVAQALAKTFVVVKGVFNGFATAIAGFAAAMEQANIHLWDLANPGGVAAKLATSTRAMDTLRQATQDVGDTAKNTRAELERLQKAWDNPSPLSGGPGKDYLAHTGEMFEGFAEIDRQRRAPAAGGSSLSMGPRIDQDALAQATEGMAAEEDARAESLRQLTAAQAEANAIVAAGKTPLQEYWENVFTLQDALQRGWIKTWEFDQGMRGLNERMDESKTKTEETASALSTFAEQAQRNIQDQVGQTFEDAMSGHFDNILQDWADMLTKMAAQAAAAQFNEALFGKDGKGGGWISTAANWAKDIFGGGKAAGGPVSAGMFYRVNENGPEMLSVRGKDYLMMGGQGGRVTPNSRLGGGPVFKTTINVQSPDGNLSRRSLRQLHAEQIQLQREAARNL